MILTYLFQDSDVKVTVPECPENSISNPEKHLAPSPENGNLSHLCSSSWFFKNPELPKRVNCSGSVLAILNTCRHLFFSSLLVLYSEATFHLPVDQPIELFYKAWPDFASRIQYVSLDPTIGFTHYMINVSSGDFECYVCPGMLWAFPNLRRLVIHDPNIQHYWEWTTRDALIALRKNLEMAGNKNCIIIVIVRKVEHVYRAGVFPEVWVIWKETVSTSSDFISPPTFNLTMS